VPCCRSSGTATFTVTFNVSSLVGLYISATATDPSGNTSGFAEDVTTSDPPSSPDAVSVAKSQTAPGTAASPAYFAPSAAALATGPGAVGVGDTQSYLFALPASPSLDSFFAVLVDELVRNKVDVEST
jgi:hypothetical protein